MSTDPVALTQALIRCPSVTPADAGALNILATVLEDAGFKCTYVPRNGIENLFAIWGEATNGKTLGFNGHTDVVPIGAEGAWRFAPFGGVIENGILYGRGACDMKSGVAAFAAAAIDFIRNTPPQGRIALAITGDEEGNAQDGTLALLDWMKSQALQMDACIVGEPTCPNTMGEMIKIGRRGSMTAYITARGQQGHAAYPERALNPLPPLMRYLDKITSHTLDNGSRYFDPSTLALTTVDVGNPANNIIPAEGRATVNIRFNDQHTSAELSEWLMKEAQIIAAKTGVAISLDFRVSGESFLTPPGPLSKIVARAVTKETGIIPTFSTSGGTSDARFIKDHCPVVEVGLVGSSMHQVDEHVSVAHIHQLKAIYTRILSGFFA